MIDSDSGDDMKVWYHSKCMFETLSRARATTKRIETADDLEDFSILNEPEKEEVRQLIKGMYMYVLVFLRILVLIQGKYGIT